MMKKQSVWLLLIVPVLVMLPFVLLLDRDPERYVSSEKTENRVDTVSIRVQIVDSLINEFCRLNSLKMIRDDSDDDQFKVTVKNLNSPNDLLNKDWKSSGLREATLKQEGFQVEVLGQKPYDVVLSMKQEDGFVVIPAGILFTLLYP